MQLNILYIKWNRNILICACNYWLLLLTPFYFQSYYLYYENKTWYTRKIDLNTLCSIHVVAFSVCSVILSVGGRSRLKVLGVLCEFHAFGLCPWFVTEFYQSHHHGQPQTSDKYIENARHIAQAQSAGLVLREMNNVISSWGKQRQWDIIIHYNSIG